MIDCNKTEWTCICDGEGLRWFQNTVYFHIDDQYTPWQKDLIREAHRLISSRVRCLSFVEVEVGAEDILWMWRDIDGQGEILAQAENFIFPAQQQMSYSRIVFDSLETVFNTDSDLFLYVAIHELLHALGIDHAPDNLPDNILFRNVVLPLRMEFGNWDLQEIYRRYCNALSLQAIFAAYSGMKQLRSHIKRQLRAYT